MLMVHSSCGEATDSSLLLPLDRFVPHCSFLGNIGDQRVRPWGTQLVLMQSLLFLALMMSATGVHGVCTNISTIPNYVLATNETTVLRFYGFVRQNEGNIHVLQYCTSHLA